MNKKILGAGVGVMILRNNKVLLGKRHDDPDKASSALHGEGAWTMPGGKIDFGEGIIETAQREVLEETGVELDKNKLEVFCVNNNVVEDAHFVTIGLLYKDFLGEPRVMEPDEIVEWQWFELDKLPSPMYFPSDKMLKNYAAGKFYMASEG